MAINEKYSFKDFTGQTFIGVDSDEFSNTEIVGSCFAQEVLYNIDASHLNSGKHEDTERDIFPSGMNNVTFRRCNLDNCKVSGVSVIVEGGIHRKIRVMNDLQDWVLDDSTFEPIEPISKKRYLELGLSIDPNNISVTKLSEVITKI